MIDSKNNGHPTDNGGDDSERAAADHALQEIFSGVIDPKQVRKYLDSSVFGKLHQKLARMTPTEILQGMQNIFETVHELKKRNQALSEENRALRERVAYDDFTRLLTRQAFMDKLEEARGALQRDAIDYDRAPLAQAWEGGGITYCLAFIDMNKLKWINDTHGHDAGDKAIQTLAGRLRDGLRPTDSAARPGGDEFAVLIKLDGGEDIETAKKRLEALLSDMSIDHDGMTLPISASIGCHRLNSRDDPKKQIDEADKHMYRAKMKAEKSGDSSRPGF